MTLQHLRSSTANKRPLPGSMSDGQLAINTNTSSPGLFFKDSAGALVKVGPVHVGSTAPNVSPAGGGETGNTVGEQWLDTSGSTYVFKVWDGSAWRSEAGEFVNVTGDVMTGALGIIAGSAGSPGLYFSGDTNTGLYSPGADQVAISTNGTGALFIDSSGNVGVGVSGASNRLNVLGVTQIYDSRGTSTYDSLKLIGGSPADFPTIEAVSATSPLVFKTNSSERMRLDSSGRLGLGTSSPGYSLDVQGNIGATIASKTASFDAAGGSIYASFNDGTKTWRAGTGIVSAGLFTIRNHTDALNPLSITSAGLVGIGVTGPQRVLHAHASSDARLKLTDDTTGTGASDGFDVTGAGALVQWETTGIKFFTNNGSSTDERARIDSSGRLLVGTSTALANVLIKGDLGSSAATTPQQQFALATNSYNAGLSVTNYSASGYGGVISLNSSKSNTLGANTLVDNTIAVGTISFNGNDGTNFVPCAEIKAAVDGTPGANDMPGRLVFSTTADGASSPTERMRITNSGIVDSFSATSAYVVRTATGAGTAAELFQGLYSASGAASGGTASIKIYTNGNIQNTNNSYGSLSDIKLKENIVDANSQWDDLKALQVRNYNFKEGQTHTQIGLVAQEVELVSPGLVSESPDRDEEGNDLGTVTKSVNYSVLYMKAVKALQEAMERIETLEAKVAALEAQ